MADTEEKRIVDLSHVIEHGMTTYKDLPGPHICDFWVREETADKYDDGSTFQIGRIDMVANTGTYVDSPFHRYADGVDLADLPLPSLADLPGIVIRRPWENSLAIEPSHLEGRDVAVLVGIDSCNIDNMHVRARPVHTTLLGANIPICEHMTGLGSLPDEGFRFSAVPPKVRGMGTFPVRAYAVLG
jgi:arylformamidase